MASDMCVKRLTRELQALRKNPMTDPKVVAKPNESNILEWHYVIEGNKDTPYEGGYYHGKLTFPKEYPMKPPSVMMLTPSGRFHPGRRLCLSMSDFHPESWNPMWSVSTILTGLYSFMVETAPTLGSIETSLADKRRYARQSLEYNIRDAMFRKLFPEYVEIYHNRRDEAEASARNSSLLASASAAAQVDQEERQGLVAATAGVIAILSIVFAMRFL